MEIGVFTRTYKTIDLRETFERMRRDGLGHAQLNFANAGLPVFPEKLDEKTLCRIRDLAAEYEIALDALTGTFNMIGPDREKRFQEAAQFEIQCEAAAALGIPVVTLCTGSRSPEGKWSWDDRNLDRDAWDDLIGTTDIILRFAEKTGVILGVETEASNVICTAQRARDYLDSFASPHLKIIMDGANLFHDGEPDCAKVLENAFDLLGGDIVSAHAKDIRFGVKTDFLAAGQGDLDFRRYLRLLLKSGYKGPLLMHGLSEDQVPSSKAFLEDILRELAETEKDEG